MTKDQWIDFADILNKLRVIPRLILAAFGTLTALVTYESMNWYMTLPAIERTMEASGFALGIVAAVSGFSLKYAGVYTTDKQ